MNRQLDGALCLSLRDMLVQASSRRLLHMLAVAALFGSVVAAQALEVEPLSLSAESGATVRVNSHVRFSRCPGVAQPTTVTISREPTHGHVEVRDETVTLKKQSVGSSSCEGLSGPGKVVYYTSEQGYSGQDGFEYEVTGARLAGQKIAVGVKVK